MEENFDLKKYLIENKLTSNSGLFKFNIRNNPENIFITESLKLLKEIKLTQDNAVEIKSTNYGGKFKVGDILYEYHIQKMPEEMMFPEDKTETLFEGNIFNIGFMIEGSDAENPNSFRPQDNQRDPIKIYSTMYKIILDLILKEHPDYLFIYSDDAANYHNIYKTLTKNNTPPGYIIQPTINWVNNHGGQKTIVLKKK